MNIINDIKEHLRLNRTGKQSDRLTLDYTELAIKNKDRKKLPEKRDYSLIAHITRELILAILEEEKHGTLSLGKGRKEHDARGLSK